MVPVTGIKPKLIELNGESSYYQHHFTKVQTKQFKRTRYSLGSIETMGRSPNLNAKFLRDLQLPNRN